MTKLVVIFGFLMAFLAGLLVGVNRPQPLATNAGAETTTRPGGRGDRNSELDALLKLRPEQKAELKRIWSETADRGRKQHEERRRELRRQRDENIQALLSSDQKASFAKVHEDYDEQTKALEREMRANFQKSVEATKQVLDPDQRVKYEEWLRKRQWERGPRGGGPGGGDRGDRGPGGDRGDRGDRGGPPHHERDTTRRSDAGATSKPADQP